MGDRKQPAKPRKTGADPQGTRDARDDATIIQWLSTVDQDLVSGFRSLAQSLLKRDKTAPTAPGAIEQKPVQLSEVAQALRPNPIVPVARPEAKPTGEETARFEPASPEPGLLKSLVNALTSALGSLRGMFGRHGDEGMLRAAQGANFVTQGPTRLLVGEAGPEKVEVKPLSQGRKPGPLDRPEGGEMRMQGGGSLFAGIMHGVSAGVGIANLIPGVGKAVEGFMKEWVKPFLEIAQHMVEFVQRIREANRALAEFSPSMALVFSQSRVRDIQRGFRLGEGTAGTAGNLEKAMGDLKDTFAPVSALIRNNLNIMLSSAVKVLELTLIPLSKVAEGINKVLEYLGLLKPVNQGGISIGQWLDEIRDDEKERERRAQQPFRPRFAGGLP
jgi:hypothetical protein